MKSSFERHRLPGSARSAFVPAGRIDPLAVATQASATAPTPLEAVSPEPGLADETRSALEALQQAAEELRASQVSQLEVWSSAALEAGLILARRVLERELSIDPQALMPLITRAVASLEGDEPVEVFLHPADLERLEQSDAPEILTADAVTLRARAALARGQASVSNRSSRVAVTIDALLESLHEECLAGWELPK